MQRLPFEQLTLNGWLVGLVRDISVLLYTSGKYIHI